MTPVEPFFELFRIVSLAPLNAAQCGCLWKVVIGEGASERQQRALEILTGGSPRYVVIVAGFARHRFPAPVDGRVGATD